MSIKNWPELPKKLFLLALILRLILIFISGYHPDVLNHIDWGKRFWQYGPTRFYEESVWGVSWPNQPPGTIYLFAAIAKLYQGLFSFLWWLNLRIPAFPSFIFPFLESRLHIVLLKLPFVLADLGIGWLIYWLVRDLTRDKRRALLGASLFLFNPALIYNSTIWGQTDSLINFLALLALWLIDKKRYFGGIFSFILSLYFKLSLIIWAPIFFLIIFLRGDFKRVVLPIILSFLLIIFASFPFSGDRNPASWLWYLYTNRVFARQGNMLSGNAFNLWTLIYGVDLSLKEGIAFLGFSAKLVGRAIFLLLGLIICALYLKNSRENRNSPSIIHYSLFAILLISFAAFLFLTNMHERYLYPIFAPLAILVAIGRLKFRWYFLLSFIHWLNLYHLWWYPQVSWLRRILEGGRFFLARIFSLALIFIFGQLLVRYNRSNEA